MAEEDDQCGVHSVDMTSYYVRKLAKMEREVAYLLGLSKRELAIRYAALEDAVNHVAMRSHVWNSWKDNIDIWESQHGYVFDGDGKKEGMDKLVAEAYQGGVKIKKRTNTYKPTQQMEIDFERYSR
jgi:hypothetical protein